MIILATSTLLFSSCGDAGNSGDDSDKKDGSTAACNGKNDLSFTIADFDADPSDFKTVKAWRGGWSFGAKENRLNVYITFTKEDYKVSKLMGADISKLDQVVQLNINANMFNPKEEPIELEAGTFPYGKPSGKEASAQIVLLENGSGQDQFPNAEGSATITSISETEICGSANFTSENGNTISINFSVPFEAYDSFSMVRKKG